MNLELQKNWFVFVQKICDIILPTCFLLEARNIPIKDTLLNKDVDLSQLISQEMRLSEYVNYSYSSDRIEFIMKSVERAISFSPEEITVFFLDGRCQSPSEYIATKTNDLILTNDNLCCTVTAMLDESVFLVSSRKEFADKIREILN